MNDTVNWDDPALKRWLGSITRKTTVYCYRSAFRAYQAYTAMTASQLIDEALEDAKLDQRQRRDIVLTRIIGFYGWLKKDYEVKSRGKGPHKVIRKGLSDKLAHAWTSSIRSFYATFGVVVRLKGRHRLPKARVTNRRMKVAAEQVKVLVDHARTPRDRAIVLTLFQSGMDVSTLCSLTYGDVQEGLRKNDHPLKLDLYRPKTGVEYYTFLGKDAVQTLKAYIKDVTRRGITFTAKSPLFVKERKEGASEAMTTNLVQNVMREIAIKSGYVDDKMNGKDFNPLGPHALRESFGSLLINSGVPDTIVDFFLGHEIGEMAEAYKSVQADSLKRMYLEREKLVSISQPPVDLEEVKQELERKVEDRNRQLQGLVNGLTVENLDLKSRLAKVELEVTGLRSNLEKVRPVLDALVEDSRGLALLKEKVKELKD